MTPNELKVILYIPNIIGYLRLALVTAATLTFEKPHLFIPLYSTAVVLDYFDGMFARKLKQTSVFGAWFDVVIDNLGRSMLWSKLYKEGWLISSIEWLTFVCSHSHGANWKGMPQAPAIVKSVMRNNFRTLIGSIVIGGLHLLPLWLYGFNSGWLSTQNVPYFIQNSITAMLVAGRALCFLCEGWLIWSHITKMIRQPIS